MSKQSDWTWTGSPTETIVNEGRVVKSGSGHIGGVVARHHIKTAAMWFHDFVVWKRWIT